MSLVLTERRGPVLVITLNRPEVRNAVNSALAGELAATLDAFDGDGELQAAVLTGTGKGFCSGMDLRARLEVDDRGDGGDRGFAGIVRRPPAKPIVAAVEGFALAGGLEIALACDLMVAARGAQLGIPEVKRSLIAAGGAMRRLPQRLPRALALELVLTGDPISAERGYELGLVNALTEPGGALKGALELAARITPNAPLALAGAKRIMAEQDGWSDEQFWELQEVVWGPVSRSADAREGAAAFLEKRVPVWRGE
jgi:enoyl-CoA hydratase